MQEDLSFEEVDFDPSSSFNIEKVVSPIDPQREIWISCMLGGEDANRGYNESIVLKLHGMLNVDALLNALEEVVTRHEALRTTFAADGKSICIHEGLMPQYRLEDLSGLSRDQSEQHIQEYLKDNATIPFDLSNGPLTRAALFKISDKEHQFIFTAHHIICDGWSFGIITRELSEIYSAFIKEIRPNLPDPYPFSQYAEDMSYFMVTDRYKEIERYWLGKFDSVPNLLELPHDWPAPEVRTYKSARHNSSLDGELVKAVKDLGAGANASFISTLIVAFEACFYKRTGQTDIVIGLPTSGQAATGNFNLVGHCVNVLPVRGNPSSSVPFVKYLRERSVSLASDYDHQQLTFSSLIRKLNIKREASRVPLIPFVLNIDMGLDNQLEFEQLTYQLETGRREFETFEIFLNISGAGGEALRFEWSYNTQLFKEETIVDMMEDLEAVLHQVVSNPDVLLGDLILPSNRVLEQLEVWNNTRTNFPLHKRFTQLITEMASAYPDKPAIEFRDRLITYRELEETSNAIGVYLRDRGLGREDIVGVYMQRSPEMVMTMLGIVKSGAAYLPLDPEYPRDRIEYMLQNSRAKLLIKDEELEANFGAPAEEINSTVIWVNLIPSAKAPEISNAEGADLAYVLYTSGSTGKPKGVQIEHRNLTNFLLSMQLAPGIKSDDRLLAITTISFDISGLELFLPLITGATIILADTATARDGRVLLQWIEEKSISFLQATPATWRMLFSVGWEKPMPLKALCGGEALPIDLAQKLLAKCHSVWNVYGPTETTIWSTVKELKAEDPVLTVGRPIHNTQVYLLDVDRKPVALGSVGEIYIGGDGVARGYLGRPDLTGERFFDNPFVNKPGSRIYQTGDLGRFLGNGEIVCLGRVDHQVKVRGYRIELGEVETAITRINGVKESVVIAREDTPGNQRLVAYLLLDEGVLAEVQEPTKEQVQYWKGEVQKSLPNYMVPNDWLILKEYPLTANNKVDRKRLPKPSMVASSSEIVDSQSMTSEEKLIAKVWSTVLGVNDIKPESDFFDLGGHSLLAVEVMTLVERETGKRIPLNSLFRYPVLRDFSLLFEEKTSDKADSWSSLVPIKPSGTKPPLYLIHGAGSYVGTFFVLAKKMDADQPVYGIQAKGLNGIDEPFTSISEMAAYYIDIIMKHNPTGPYYIGGQSFGGYVAYEMAKQMKSMNKEVKKLLLFDIDAYQSERPLTKNENLRKKLTYEFMKRCLDIKLLVKYPNTFFKMKRSSMERKKVKLMAFLKGHAVDANSDVALVIEKIRKINHDAMDKYLMSYYDGDVYLFKAKERIFYIEEKEFYGWKPYVRNVKVIDVEGNHNTMFEEPLVAGLAEHIANVLGE